MLLSKRCYRWVLRFQLKGGFVKDVHLNGAIIGVQVDRMRLSAERSWGHPTHEQQVLHYQWIADMGSTEAQRTLGQLLTQSAHRDPEQAARYFRSGGRSTHSVPHLGLSRYNSGSACACGKG